MAIQESAIKGWISRQAPKLRDNTHMMFMYGEKDIRGKCESEFFFNEVLVGRGNTRLGLNPLNEKYLHKVVGAGQLSGRGASGQRQDAQNRIDHRRIPLRDPERAGQAHPQATQLHLAVVYPAELLRVQRVKRAVGGHQRKQKAPEIAPGLSRVVTLRFP